MRDDALSRKTIIQKEVEAIDQDRQGILTEIGIVYDQARHLLNSAERISRIMRAFRRNSRYSRKKNHKKAILTSRPIM